MKKITTFTILSAILLFYSNQSFAKIRRVGYFGPPVAGTDYINLQSAHDASVAKDTILLFPGRWTGNISKKIIVLGYGYFVSGNGANSNLQNIKEDLRADINLNSGADSSVYEGIGDIDISAAYNQIVNKVIVRRCNGNVYFYNRTYDGWQIIQSYIYISYHSSGGRITNLKVDNCYLSGLSIPAVQSNGTESNGQFANDIFYDGTPNFGSGNFVIKNSILLADHSNDENCVYTNSIGNAYYDPISSNNGNKNITYSGMRDSVFVGYSDQDTYSNDGRFMLKPGSLAKGAGAGGTDCGIFGGSNPYKLSGIPKIPSFYKLSAPNTVTGTNPYTITFSVRSNN